MPRFVSLFVLCFFTNFSASSIEFIESNCKPVSKEDSLTARDYVPLARGPSEIFALYQEIYNGPKRNPNAFFFEDGAFRYRNEKRSFQMEVPDAFISKLLKHLSDAMSRGWGEYLFMSDLGHGHFLIPRDVFEENQEVLEKPFTKAHYSFLSQSPDVKILYHSYEFYKRPEYVSDYDSHNAFRNENRNLLGSLDHRSRLRVMEGPGGVYNLLSSIAGFRGYGGLGFNANAKGCFVLRMGEQVVNLDLSFDSPL